MDVIVALLLGLAFLPLAIVVAVLLAVFQRKVLFRQIRPGLHGNPFTLYKFCSMRDARDKDGNLLPDDVRLTPIGAILRSLSLDELPQLWNVLKGDMSIVGPRPLLMNYLSRYSPEQARRHDIKPGITGWSQVNGRNALNWDQRFQYDVWYVDHASFALDLRIIFLTVIRVLRRSGITDGKNATMSEFLGSRSAD